MELNVSRFFSDRLVFDGSLQIKNSLWDWFRWIWSPSSYLNENRSTLRKFKAHAIHTLGDDRFQRICKRYGLNFELMEKKGTSLSSRDVAKVVIGSKDVHVQEIEKFETLNCAKLAQKIEHFQSAFPWNVPRVEALMSGAPTEWISSVFYDPFLADRERLQLSEKQPSMTTDVYFHYLLSRVVKREMDVGALIRAPDSGKIARFYYVAAKVVTGDGMVSYIFKPAGTDNDLKAIRLFRGTSPRSSDLDALSGVITDLESDLGRAAYESGKPFEEIIEKRLGLPAIEAGHSLGSTIVQYRLANTSHIQKAYLFCGPGLPESEVAKFNRRSSKPSIKIIHMSQDTASTIGKIHLGYKAGIEIDFTKAYPNRRRSESPHVQIAGGRGPFGIEGGFTKKRLDKELYNKDNLLERIRSVFGPPVSLALRAVRYLSRKAVQSRVEMLKGVQIGTFHQGRFQVEHFR